MGLIKDKLPRGALITAWAKAQAKQQEGVSWDRCVRVFLEEVFEKLRAAGIDTTCVHPTGGTSYDECHVMCCMALSVAFTLKFTSSDPLNVEIT